MSRLADWLRGLRPDVTLRDVHAYGGLAIAGFGGWQLSPAWTCVVVGGVLLVMGLFLQRKAAP